MDEFVQVNDTTYFVTNVGIGPPLLLLHGFTGSGQSWAAQTAVFSHHFRTITIDLLGHGRTDSPANPDRYQMEQAAADIIAILEKQKVDGKRQKFHLLGYSMGGRLALYLALNYPEWFCSLVLESASPGLDTAVKRAERTKQDNDLADWIEANGIEAFVNRWEQLPLWASQSQLTQETRLALRQQRLQNNPAGLANSLRGMGTGRQPSLWPYLPQLNLPVLLLAGALDLKFIAINQQMAAQIPQSQLHIIPGAGHTIHLERPSLFNKLALEFWRQF
jgi:2-succinyl-6-hydroxy-2,4-cyclohexadiene-1-carboxylate synthase